jgi:branched-chain amino acid transport system permease protein
VQIPIGNATISNYVILDISVAAVLMIGLTLLVRKSALGKAMRAVSQDKDAARLMGIDVEKVIGWTFLIGGAFAGAAGLLSGMTYPRIFPYMGILPGLKAFIAAVLGGIGNIPGAVLGAYIMGLAETFASAYNSLLGEGIAFAILILVLLVRPRGLLGEKTADKI